MKKLIALLICVLLVGNIVVGALAAENNTFTIKADKTSLKRGDVVTFTVTYSGTDVAKSLGITLSFDSNVFELVPGSGTVDPALSSISFARFNDSNKGFVAMLNSAMAYNGPIGTFQLKVKADTTTFGNAAVSGTPSVKNGSVTIPANVQPAAVSVVCQHSYGAWTKLDDTHHVHTCSICSGTETQSHSLNAGTVTKDPTCKDEGVKTRTCSVCNGTVEEVVPKTENHSYGNWIDVDDNTHKHICSVCQKEETAAHKWDGGKTTTQPTCKDTGIKTYTCSECGGTKTEVLPKTNDHSYGSWIDVDDNTHKHVCSVCQKEETAAHKWDGGMITTQPTCNADGVKTYTCSECKGTKTETVKATGEHTYGDWTKVDEKTHKHVCTGCGVASETANHTWDGGKVTTQPTCNAEGVKTFTCTGCEATRTEPVEATGKHTYGDWTKVDENTHKHVCTGCGEASETANHTWDGGKTTTQPTCNADGVKTYTCTGCKATRTEPVKSTGAHTYGDWTKVDEKTHKHVCTGCGVASETADHTWNSGNITTEPTCTKTGIKTFTCTGCNATRTETVAATGIHTYGDWTKVDENTHKHTCTVCGEASETAGHKWDGGKVTKDPTCKDEGVKTFTCSDCKATKTQPIEKTNDHKYGQWTDVDDNNHKHVCSVCQKEESAAHTWNNGAVTKPATCKEEGVKTFTCTGCGKTRTEVIEKLTTHTFDHDCDTDCNVCGLTRQTEHKYNEKWSADWQNHWHACSVCGDKKDTAKHTPGAAATEYTAQTCTECGYVLVPALGHQHKWEDKLTSDENGHWYSCGGCNEKKDEAAHTFENDCDTDCADCGFTRTTEHKFADAWASDANNHWHECSVCGEKKDEEAHAPGVEATEDTAQTCTICEYELVAALGHTHVFGEGWKNDADKHWHECDCGEKDGEAAHTWNEGEENEDGTMKYTCTECMEEKTEGEPRGNFPWWILIVVGLAAAAAAAVVVFKKKKA